MFEDYCRVQAGVFGRSYNIPDRDSLDKKINCRQPKSPLRSSKLPIRQRRDRVRFDGDCETKKLAYTDNTQSQKGPMEGTPSKTFLLGNAALVVWGEVDSDQVDEPALNDWWTNEHLPERLSILGFKRARRYFSPNESASQTKYLTLYEVSDLDVLTSTAYMEKLNNPTEGTEKHIPTLATMQRSACKPIHSEARQDLRSCGTGLGATTAMFVLSLPASEDTSSALQDVLSKAFSAMQSLSRSAMNPILLEEDKAATAPGSSSQSYLNVKLKPTNEGGRKNWIVLFEFSTTIRQSAGGIEKILKPVVNELSVAYGKPGEMTFDVYEFMCSVRA